VAVGVVNSDGGRAAQDRGTGGDVVGGAEVQQGGAVKGDSGSAGDDEGAQGGEFGDVDFAAVDEGGVDGFDVGEGVLEVGAAELGFVLQGEFDAVQVGFVFRPS
jgi:hypothetical protein